MALDITKPEQLEKFLADKPVEWSQVIAVRAALRVLPVALTTGLPESVWFPTLRACFISWAANVIGNIQPNPTALYASESAYKAATSVAPPDSHAARTAGIAAEITGIFSTRDSESIPIMVANAIGFSFDCVSRRGGHAEFDSDVGIYSALNADIELLYYHKNDARAVSIHRLWPYVTPFWAKKDWSRFSNNSRAFDKGYRFWISWYNLLLDGNVEIKDFFGNTLLLRLAQQSPNWWSRQSQQVNADIAAWLEEKSNYKHEFIDKVSEVEKQLSQHPAAASFVWTDNRLSVNAPTPLPPASLAQDFLDEVRVKALDLRDRLAMTNAAQRVRKSLDGVITILPEQATDLRPGLLRSRARSVHADAMAYAGQFQDGELPVDATAMIIDLSGGLRDLEGCFPELRDIEREIAALNLKPTDVPAVQKHLEEINKVASASLLVTDNAKAVMAVGTETMKAEAALEIIEVRTAEQALTARNLVNAALRGSLQQILSRVSGTTGRVYDETEKAGLNVIRPVVSVGTALALGAGATVLFGGFFGPIFALAALGLAEYDRLPGIINFIKAASNANKDADDDSGSSDSDEK